MSPLRHRLIALTCAAATLLSTAGVTTADAAAPSRSAPWVTGARNAHPGLARLLADGTPNGRAIVTFASVPTPGEVAALRALGLTVQPMRRLPMALVAGPVAQLASVPGAGIGLGVYPDEELDYLDTASTNAMSSTARAAKALRVQGSTGKGITVGIIDSGCDGTHPDIAERITHNVTLLSPEYANAGTEPTIVVPIDLGSGHVGAVAAAQERGDFSSNGLQFDNGRAVAIGADGHTILTGDRIGNTQPDIMAPGADISSTCDSTGSVIGPCPTGGNATASGTSMASPHIAGAAAVLLQANRRLSWAQVQDALTATAMPVV